MNLRPMGYSLFLGSVLLLAKAAFGDPAADFSQAVSLFNAKDYKSALPLFQQIVASDPGNAQAYYYLGSCQETAGDLRGEVLDYYISNKLSPDADMKAYADKIMEKLSPEDQDWVEKSFDAFSKPAAQPAPQSPPPALSGDYSQAVSLYESKDYPAALPLFQQVVQDQPDNAKAFYYLGRCQDKAGYPRGAALNFYISNRIQPYPALKLYADKVMAKLSPEDQDWVEKHLDNLSQPAAPEQASALPAPSEMPRFGFRISSSVAVFGLSDFQSDLSSRMSEVAQFQTANPSVGYRLQDSLASMGVAFEVNPYLAFGNKGEVGLAFDYWPPTSYSYNITASIDPQYFVRSEYDISTFELLLKGRWYFAQTHTKRVSFFLEPAMGIQPIGIHQTYDYAHTAATPSDDHSGGDFNSSAFDTGFKLGTAFQVNRNGLLCFSAGYQWANASGFTGNWNDTGNAAKDGAAGSLQVFTNPSTGQSVVIFVPTDPSRLSAFGENSATLAYCKPLTVDLSGLRFTADFSWNF